MVRTKLSKVAAIIYKTSYLIHHDGMYILYGSLFPPNINYCREILGNTYVTNIRCNYGTAEKSISSSLLHKTFGIFQHPL